MRCRWWKLVMVMLVFGLPISVSTGCGNAHMSQDEADALAEEGDMEADPADDAEGEGEADDDEEGDDR